MIQQTLTKSVTVTGVGLHSGESVTVVLIPALTNTGIVFKRTDVGISIPATPFNTAHTPLQTKLLAEDGATSIDTPEHLLAALAGLEIDNCVIEVSGAEIPILDGSAQPWVEALDSAGRTAQNEPRKIHVIQEAIHIEHAGRVLSAEPDPRPGLRLSIHTDFPILGRGELAAKADKDFFRAQIAPARTFCFESDVKAMQAAGLALGGSLDNAVVFNSEGTPLNPEGLRFPDEVLRHKFLDAVGDLFLGGFIQGKINLTLPGHTANNVLLRKIFA